MQFSWKNPLRALSVLLLAVYAGTVFAATAGHVQFVIGDVKLITKTGVTRALVKGGEVDEGDRIVTAAGASAQIKMVDGGFIAVRPSTDLRIDTYHYVGKNDGKESAILSLLKGGFRTITGIIGHTDKKNYLIKTATATIGIRGTDHEPMVILPPAPGHSAIGEPGTYDKVNVGIAYIRTDFGSVNIQRNQVGFAPITATPPVILPSIPPFYTATRAPEPQKAAAAAEKNGGEQSSATTSEEKAAATDAATRSTDVVDPTNTVTTAPAATPLVTVAATVAPTVAIIAQDPTGLIVNTTTLTTTTASGTTTPISSTTPTPTPTPTTQNPVAASYIGATMFPVATSGGFNYGFSPDNPLQANTNYLLDGSGNLVEASKLPFQVQANPNGSVLTPSITGTAGADIKWSGGTAADTFKLVDNSIYAGRWVGSTVTVTDNSAPTSVYTYTPADSLWALLSPPAAGYVQSLVGTSTYTMAGHTTPVDALGTLGTLNSASLSANFSNQTVDAAVNLTMGSGPMAGTFNVSASAMPIQATTSVNSSGFGVPNASALTTACTAGTCAAGSAGYSADIGGSFAGSGAASAGLSYNIWPTTTTSAPATDSVQGMVAFTTATAPTVLTGGPFAAYSPTYTAVEVATPFSAAQIGSGSLVAPADLTFTGGGLSSFTDRDIGSGGSNTYSVIGASTPVTANATSFSSTGVQFGRWTSATALQASYTTSLGAQSGAPTTWIYGPQGYLDSPSPLTGTFAYALDGSTAPYDKQSGLSGTLTSASLSADFTNQTASASLGLTVGGQAWSASTTTPVSFGSSNQFSASSSPGGTGNNLTVSTGAGTAAACTTCYGNLAGAFTGQNYAGAILSYDLWDDGNAGGNVVGHAAFVRSGAVTNGTPVANNGYFVADYGGNVQTVDSLNNPAGSNSSTPGGVLTAYSSGSSASTSNGYYETTVNCTSCTVTPATNATTAAAPTGIYFGTWDAGSITNTWGVPLSALGTYGAGNPYWITGPEAGPLFLPSALTGTKTFAFDGGMVTNGNGVTGTVLGTTSLTADFTRQVVGINLDLSVNDTAPTPTLHTWNAKTLPGNEAIMNGGKGLGGVAFQAGTGTTSGPGTLTVTVDGSTQGNGSVSGQLTGTGLNGAIMSYDLYATLGGTTTSPTFEQVNGVASFVAPASDVATAHRSVLASATDPSSIIAQPVLGYDANSPTRMLTDATGNLTQFDMTQINKNGSNDVPHTLSIGSSVPTEFGTDPVSGISWGRWAGGSMNVTNRVDGTSKPLALAGSLHWIAGPIETAAVTLPISGTFSYVKAGATSPTDNLGNVGVLNSATLTANFTAQTVDLGVNATIAGSTLGASASAVPIIQRTAFAAGPSMPAPLTVTCSGTCGTSARGSIVGGFTGAGAVGAAMAYSLEKVGGLNASITSGVVAFHR